MNIAILLLMVVTSPAQLQNRKRYIRGAIILAVFGIGLYFILPQIDGLEDTKTVLLHAHRGWLVLAAFCLLATYPVAALIYRLLSIKHLHYGRTVVVQMAGMFAGRLLPGSAGELGLNFLFFRREEYDRAQAVAIIMVNNAIGVIGNVVLVTTLIIGGAQIPAWTRPKSQLWLLGLLPLAAVLLILTLRKTAIVQRIRAGLNSVWTAVAAYRERPLRLLLVLICCISVTLIYTLLLYACAKALGQPLTYAAAVIVMTIGVVGASITPTPGGIGGAEAALVGILTLYRLDASAALAVTLLYRLFTYWLGLIIGGTALIFVTRRQYI